MCLCVRICQQLAGRLTKLADNESVWTVFKLDLCYCSLRPRFECCLYCLSANCIKTTNDGMCFYRKIIENVNSETSPSPKNTAN